MSEVEKSYADISDLEKKRRREFWRKEFDCAYWPDDVYGNEDHPKVFLESHPDIGLDDSRLFDWIPILGDLPRIGETVYLGDYNLEVMDITHRPSLYGYCGTIRQMYLRLDPDVERQLRKKLAEANQRPKLDLDYDDD